MPNRHSAGSRDDNEPGILAVLKARSIKYFLLSEGAGADILVYISPLTLIEVKNPAYKWELTKTEKAVKEFCDNLKNPYFVVETPEEMSRIIDDWFRSEGIYERKK